MTPTTAWPSTAWRTAIRNGLVSGAVASLFSAAALAIRGKHEAGSAAGPNNGPSQWVYGRSAAYRRAATLRYTLVGYLVHHFSSTLWATLYERVFGASRRAQPAGIRALQAAATAVVANIVDYQLTPRRFQPGFDVQLSRKSLVYVYAAFALGLYVACSSRAGETGSGGNSARTMQAGGNA